MAAIRGDGKAVKVLVDNGAELDKTNGKGSTPLHLAILANANGCTSEAKTLMLRKAKMLLEQGADPRKENDDGDSPMSLAAKWGHREMFVFLRGLRPRRSTRPNLVWRASDKILSLSNNISEFMPRFSRTVKQFTHDDEGSLKDFMGHTVKDSGRKVLHQSSIISRKVGSLKSNGLSFLSLEDDDGLRMEDEAEGGGEPPPPPKVLSRSSLLSGLWFSQFAVGHRILATPGPPLPSMTCRTTSCLYWQPQILFLNISCASALWIASSSFRNLAWSRGSGAGLLDRNFFFEKMNPHLFQTLQTSCVLPGTHRIQAHNYV